MMYLQSMTVRFEFLLSRVVIYSDPGYYCSPSRLGYVRLALPFAPIYCILIAV